MQTLPKLANANTRQSLTDTTIYRRQTRPVKVGNITIGGGYLVVLQSIINEDTLNTDGSVAAIRRLHKKLAARLSALPYRVWLMPKL